MSPRDLVILGISLTGDSLIGMSFIKRDTLAELSSCIYVSYANGEEMARALNMSSTLHKSC